MVSEVRLTCDEMDAVVFADCILGYTGNALTRDV